MLYVAGKCKFQAYKFTNKLAVSSFRCNMGCLIVTTDKVMSCPKEQNSGK